MKGTEEGYFEATEDGRQVHSPTPQADRPARGGRGPSPPFLLTAIILAAVIAAGVFFSLSAVGPDQAPAQDLGAKLPSPAAELSPAVEEGVPGLTPKALKGLAEAAARVLHEGDQGILPGMFEQASAISGCTVAGYPGWAEVGDLKSWKVRQEARAGVRKTDNASSQELSVAFGSHKGTWVVVIQGCI